MPVADLLAVAGNNVCADCHEPEPKWTSINLGIFICIHCAGIHRSIGAHITQMRSVLMDEFTSEQEEFLRSKGNLESNKEYEKYLNPKQKLTQHDNDEYRDKFIRAKYVDKLFVNEKGLEVDLRRSSSALRQSKNNASTEYTGILRVNLIEGINLVVRDIVSSDPYCILEVGMQKIKSKVIQSTLNPQWNEILQLCIPQGEKLKITVMDQDFDGKDDFMGSAEISLEDLTEGVEEDYIVDLDGVKKGTVHFKLLYTSISH